MDDEEMFMEPLEALAKGITLGLAGLTQLSVKIFENLGVDMTSVDQAIADWTDYATNLKDQRDTTVAALNDAQTALGNANTEIQNLKDTDQIEDAQQIAAAVEQANNEAAAKLEEALAALQNPPEQPPPIEPPVEEVPPPGVPTGEQPPVPVDPEVPPTPAGELPPDTPVVEVPPETQPPVELPPDAPVVPAGDLPPETPVVPVEPPPDFPVNPGDTGGESVPPDQTGQ